MEKKSIEQGKGGTDMLTNRLFAKWLKEGPGRQYRDTTEDIVHSTYEYHWCADDSPISSHWRVRDKWDWFSSTLLGKRTDKGFVETAKGDNGPFLIEGKWYEKGEVVCLE